MLSAGNYDSIYDSKIITLNVSFLVTGTPGWFSISRFFLLLLKIKQFKVQFPPRDILLT